MWNDSSDGMIYSLASAELPNSWTKYVPTVLAKKGRHQKTTIFWRKVFDFWYFRKV